MHRVSAPQGHARVTGGGKTQSATRRWAAGTCRLRIAAARPPQTGVRHRRPACGPLLVRCHRLRRRRRCAANIARYSALRHSTYSAERTDRYRSSPGGRRSRPPPRAFQRPGARPRLEKVQRDEGSRHKGSGIVAKEPETPSRVSAEVIVLGVRGVLGGNNSLYPKPV